MSQVGAVWAITRKNIRVYYLKGPVLIFGVFFPACLFFAFAIGRQMPAEQLVPGLIGMAIFFTASATTPAVLPFETRTRTLERLLVAPVSVAGMIAGDILAAFLFGLFLSLVPILISVLVVGATVPHPLLFVATIVIAAVCFAALGTLFSTPATDVPADVMMLSNLVRLPLIFFSGVFMPIAEMPQWGQWLSVISPLTWCTELIRHTTTGDNLFDPAVALPMLVLYTAALCLLSIALHQRNMSRRLAL
ncbi:MAG: ABC transporter permease [Armatimonadota bacterium]|nr:ABC transporter permease [Armatimonadota bacterium]